MRLGTLEALGAIRLSLNHVLIPELEKLPPGVVLDIGAKFSPYREHIPYTRYLTLDVDASNNPDLCCDVHDIEWESDYFDTIVATEVLEHLYDPQRAVREWWRVLKPGGTCVGSTRFMYIYHPDPHDYYRFSEDGLRYLFRDFSSTAIYAHGNGAQVIWHIINNGKRPIRALLNVLNPLVARLDFPSVDCPAGFVVVARK